MQVPASRPSPTGQVGPEMPAPAEPDRVVRAYSPPGDSFTLCGLDASVGGGPSETSVGWCNSADVTGKPGGYTFRAVVCRSSDQQAAQLHPESVPLRMRVTRGDTDVWHLTIGSEPRDALATEPGGCWIWSTDWDGLGDDGRPVRSGSYELSAAVLAEELPDTGDRTAAFEVGQS